MTSQIIDPKTIKLIGGDYIDSREFEDLIIDFEGMYADEDQFVIFDVNGTEYTITYDFEISGHMTYEPADWDSPGYQMFDLDSFSVDIIDIEVNETSIEMTEDLVKTFTKAIKDLI